MGACHRCSLHDADTGRGGDRGRDAASLAAIVARVTTSIEQHLGYPTPLRRAAAASLAAVGGRSGVGTGGVGRVTWLAARREQRRHRCVVAATVRATSTSAATCACAGVCNASCVAPHYCWAHLQAVGLRLDVGGSVPQAGLQQRGSQLGVASLES